jgi:hypothetical protein
LALEDGVGGVWIDVKFAREVATVFFIAKRREGDRTTLLADLLGA